MENFKILNLHFDKKFFLNKTVLKKAMATSYLVKEEDVDLAFLNGDIEFAEKVYNIDRLMKDYDIVANSRNTLVLSKRNVHSFYSYNGSNCCGFISKIGYETVGFIDARLFHDMDFSEVKWLYDQYTSPHEFCYVENLAISGYIPSDKLADKLCREFNLTSVDLGNDNSKRLLISPGLSATLDNQCSEFVNVDKVCSTYPVVSTLSKGEKAKKLVK